MPAEAGARAVLAFAALGDDTRLALAERLANGPASIVSLTEGTSMSRQAITKHLRVMENAGLVRCHRIGRMTLWQLERKNLQDAGRHLDRISRQWDDALKRLRHYVES